MKKLISIILMLVALLNYAYAKEDNSIISKTEEYSEDGFKIEKSEESEIIEKNKWDKTNVYPESDVVKNYGANSDIGSISREMYQSNGKNIMRYKYMYSPDDLVNYYTHLGYNSGYTLDLQTLDSNELFLDCTYKNRTTYVHIFVNLLEGTVTIEFPRTKIPEI